MRGKSQVPLTNGGEARVPTGSHKPPTAGSTPAPASISVRSEPIPVRAVQFVAAMNQFPQATQFMSIDTHPQVQLGLDRLARELVVTLASGVTWYVPLEQVRCYTRA